MTFKKITSTAAHSFCNKKKKKKKAAALQTGHFVNGNFKSVSKVILCIL